jgi:hypothetical protein
MEKYMIKCDYNSLIYEIRGYKVIIDYDLATLYCTKQKD